MRDYYNILGVEPDASDAEIKRMYHKLSKKYHPDANITDPDLLKWSEARMKELNEAYNVLRDPLKRAEHDRRRGHVRPNPRPSSAPAASRSSPMTQLRESIVVQSMAINALIFGLFGLMRGGLPVALSGAAIGALIGAVLARIRIAGLPPAISQGFLVGMFLGAILFKGALLTGVLLGGAIGALAGWWLMSR